MFLDCKIISFVGDMLLHNLQGEIQKQFQEKELKLHVDETVISSNIPTIT